VKFPHGEYIFCELPDGTIGGFPSWIADAAKTSDVTVGEPQASAAALAELCALLRILPPDKQRELVVALADLLLNAAADETE
jgi:hypothetical protein